LRPSADQALRTVVWPSSPFHQVVRRVGVSGQAQVQGQAVVFDPEAPVLLA